MAGGQTQSKRAEERRAAGEGLDLSGLTHLLGFHVRMANLALYRDFMAALRGFDLSQKQTAVLTLIDQNPGCSQIDLAAVLGVDRATMMTIVDRLQDRGLLYRTRSIHDRRRQELYLTDEGRSVLSDAGALIARHEARFTERFTPAELASLKEMLGRLERD